MNLQKLAILGFLAGSALVLSGCDLLGNYQSGKSGGTSGESKTAKQESGGNTSNSGEEATVTFSDSGVTAQVTVKSGGSVKWVNSSSAKVQVASDPHPTHTTNPEITTGDFVMEIAPGGSTSVTVTKAGTWGFHNHLKPAVRGKIVVE